MTTKRKYTCNAGHTHELLATAPVHRETAHRGRCQVCGGAWTWSVPVDEDQPKWGRPQPLVR